MNNLTATYEKWFSGKYDEIKLEVEELKKLEHFILEMSKDSQGVLWIENEDYFLDINVGEGLFSMSILFKGSEKSYRLVNPHVPIKDTLGYVIGGQLVTDFPARFIIDHKEAIKHALLFWTNPDNILDQGNWE